MKFSVDRFTWSAAVMFILLGLFNLAIGVYHTILFTAKGPHSPFSAAYGIPVSAADMRDPARLLGSDAIEVYAILLAGYGVISLSATIMSLRGQRSGFRINLVVVGIAQVAVLYGLVNSWPPNWTYAYVDVILYALGVLLGSTNLIRARAVA